MAGHITQPGSGGGGGSGAAVEDAFLVPGANTWTKPSNAKLVSIIMVGASGGADAGVHGQSNSGYGSSSGGYSQFTLPASIFNPTEPIMVGARGIGGTGSTQGNDPPYVPPTNGGDTIFGAFLVAGGAGAGVQSGVNGAAGTGVTSAGMTGQTRGVAQVNDSLAGPGAGGAGGDGLGGFPASADGFAGMPPGVEIDANGIVGGAGGIAGTGIAVSATPGAAGGRIGGIGTGGGGGGCAYQLVSGITVLSNGGRGGDGGWPGGGAGGGGNGGLPSAGPVFPVGFVGNGGDGADGALVVITST